MDRRDEFLLEMYRQMFNDINRHITVAWQSAGVVLSAFAVFAFVEKNIISADIATTIVVLCCGWLSLHLLDSGYWYNRNLVIIANIERQFLVRSDLKDIHYYFGGHRTNNKMIGHIRIQAFLLFALSGLIILYHVFTRVVPGLRSPWSSFDPVRTLPYVAAVAATIYGMSFRAGRIRSYNEFVRKSPGIEVRREQPALSPRRNLLFRLLGRLLGPWIEDRG